MYRSGGEQARAEAQQRRKEEREGIRRDFLSSREPPGNTWQQANLALLAQATELLESINTSLGSLHNVMAKIELRTDMMARSGRQDRGESMSDSDTPAWVKEGIRQVAKGLAEEEPDLVGPGFPLAVYPAVRERRPDIVKYLDDTDPGYGDHVYQTIAAWTPRALRGGP